MPADTEAAAEARRRVDANARRYRAALDKVDGRRVDLQAAIREARQAGVTPEEIAALLTLARVSPDVATR